ncbi:MAG TPA: pyridoxamine 5'-phosphate oxidase family protein, partial [Spirochaetota bacterium]
MDFIELLRVIRENPGMQLATVDGDGQPHTRGMFMYAADADGIVFHTGDFKRLYRELKTSPRVEMSFYDKNAFMQIRVRGEAVE